MTGVIVRSEIYMDGGDGRDFRVFDVCLDLVEKLDVGLCELRILRVIRVLMMVSLSRPAGEGACVGWCGLLVFELV